MKLEDIRKLCDEATPGPWLEETLAFLRLAAPDAKFAAAARTLLPLLLDVVEAADPLRWRNYPYADDNRAHALRVRLCNAITTLEKLGPVDV